MKTIRIKCCGCGKEVDKPKKHYAYRVKAGNPNLYCTLKCATIYARLDEFSPFRYFVKTAKKCSKQRNKNLEFNLDVEFLKNLWDKQGGICPYTKIKMTLFKGDEKHNPFSASLDRIDSAKGYTKDNVQFISLFVNYGKNKFSSEQTKDFLRLVNLPLSSNG